ncbi:MBL fold metallo-hydrolase [Aurantibacillus circumpalustris]|uniref:MBL fold metallo-hydrolase n=1 Tax=Aurantibacillus circumpalustris TaxID=3036359 RepID=UPI00295BF5DB|nr:MBL fold metallo-hydrolase [Aurantibacillus circumpalustris]
MLTRSLFLFSGLLLFSCNSSIDRIEKTNSLKDTITSLSLIVLGTVQDGGSPHIGCNKNCCEKLFSNPDKNRKVVSLGVIDSENKKNYLFEATPDMTSQLRMLQDNSTFKSSDIPDGVFLSHAHIGHYSGLMYFGKEAMNSNGVKVYTMPRMKTFLETNGPWSQLVSLNNIQIQTITDTESIQLSSALKVTPFLVPHRDEFSETVGYRIEGPNKKVMFIPDIDKWSKWNKDIVEEIKTVDYAFVDATFFDGQEIQNRDISQIPHPFVIESMELFKMLPEKEKNKIYFIHFNHTNPLLNKESAAYKEVLKNGFHVAEIGTVFSL